RTTGLARPRRHSRKCRIGQSSARRADLALQLTTPRLTVVPSKTPLFLLKPFLYRLNDRSQRTFEFRRECSNALLTATIDDIPRAPFFRLTENHRNSIPGHRENQMNLLAGLRADAFLDTAQPLLLHLST